ncbi:MAG: GntR family transcriptional regulator [Rubrobacteraceae bacterium]|nr:GntR family transcriptional regulator [Rubrobacteraceae bacterium]
MSNVRSAAGGGPIDASSVADRAYERIREYVLGGEAEPGTRLGQVELAERFGISRTPVREALRRLADEGLVEFQPNRGYRVADLGLEAVLRRLEVRTLLEPGIARLAAGRRNGRDIDFLYGAIEQEAAAADGVEAHDASRQFHVHLAQATGNEELVRVLRSLWIVEVGRRLLSRRMLTSDWKDEDVAEHRQIASAVAEGRAEDAERLMLEHIERAIGHWKYEWQKG